MANAYTLSYAYNYIYLFCKKKYRCFSWEIIIFIPNRIIMNDKVFLQLFDRILYQDLNLKLISYNNILSI